MKYIKLGKTDLEISQICLGTMTWGVQNNQEQAFEQMDYALDQGVNFWDTAELYSVPIEKEKYGETERIIGNYFASNKGKREEIILASKMAGKGPEWIRNSRGIIGEDIADAVDNSLKRLNTDYIDLYQLHWPNRGTYGFRNNWTYDPTTQPNKEEINDNILSVLSELDKMVKQGKIKHIGLSNESAWGVSQFIKLAEQNDLPKIASIQNEYSLLYRPFDLDLSETCHHEDVTLLTYSTLAFGLLTGKYQNGQRPAGSRANLKNMLDGRMTENAFKAVDKYLEIAAKHNLDPSQLALAFALQRPYSPSVIIGATKMEQLKINIDAINIELSQDVLDDIDKVYRQYNTAF